MLVGAILIGKSVFGDNGGSSRLDVPQLVGKTLTEAQQLAENASVKVAQSGSERCDVPKGSICSQIPASGKMGQGETIQVVVSEGAPQVKVPDVTDKQKDKATDILEGENFQVDYKTEESEQDPGTVLAQDPEGGSMVEKASKITLTIATQSQITVPPLVGTTADDAEAQLKILGFQVVRNPVDSEQPAGIVTKQTPDANAKAAKGTQVTLDVSKGPQQQQTPVPELRFKTLAEARQLLQQSGLQLGNIQGPNDDKARVINQDQPPGQQVPANTAINVTTTDGGGGNNGGGDNNGGGFFGGPSGSTG